MRQPSLLPNKNSRIIVYTTFLLVVVAVWIPPPTAWSFVQPFGVRHHKAFASSSSPPSPPLTDRSPGPAFRQSPSLQCPSSSSSSSSSFLVTNAKGGEEDEEEEWEPNADDLMSTELEVAPLLEDVDDVDVDVADIEDTTMLVVDDTDEDDTTVAAKLADKGDDDDDDDDDVDIWEEDDDDDIVEESEDDEEEYLGSEVDYEDEEWDEDEGYGNVPLEDDTDDPNYMAQKKLVEETVTRREKIADDKDFDALDFVMNKMTAKDVEVMEEFPFIKEIEEKVKGLITVDDVEALGDLDKAVKSTSDFMDDDPYENEGEEDILGTGITDDDMEALDGAWKRIHENLNKEPWNKVNYKAEITDFASLDNETIYEMDACLDEIGGSAYNSTRWLLYDLDFNVSNLILAAIQHNPKAPIIFQHWYPQLVTYERYEHARERDFDFTWEDVQNADIEELKHYYLGFGYTEIPQKAPSETGIIGFEDLDEEELKMAAFQNWMIEVYNPEWDRKDFDDDSFRDEDNVFSDFFKAPAHPDLPTFEDAQDDLRNWEEDMDEEGEDNQEYRDFMGKDFKYDLVEDEEFKKEYRGRLVVACTPMDEDLEVAEKLTKRMGEDFGKQIYVETRVIAHAREEDFVFEVWLESYEIDLLHSKKRASSNAEGWEGPADCDDDQIEHLVEEVRFLISDEARYSYRHGTDIAV